MSVYLFSLKSWTGEQRATISLSLKQGSFYGITTECMYVLCIRLRAGKFWNAGSFNSEIEPRTRV